MSKSGLKRLLVVDDQPNWREFLTELFESNKIEVTTAINYQDGINILNKKSFDLAILDICLDDDLAYNVEGMGLLDYIKKNFTSTKTVILTGFADKNIREKAERITKCDDFFEKAPDGEPLSLDEFSNRVESLIELK